MSAEIEAQLKAGHPAIGITTTVTSDHEVRSRRCRNEGFCRGSRRSSYILGSAGGVENDSPMCMLSLTI